MALGRHAHPTFLCAVDSEPQSLKKCFRALLDVAETAYLSQFLCWWLPDVSASSALGGVRCGVKRHQPLALSDGSHHTADLAESTYGSLRSTPILQAMVDEVGPPIRCLRSSIAVGLGTPHTLAQAEERSRQRSNITAHRHGVTPSCYTSGANGPSSSVKECLISLPSSSNSGIFPVKNCPIQSGNHPLPPRKVLPLE